MSSQPEPLSAKTPVSAAVTTFLDGRRLGVLNTASFPGDYPIPRPLWFVWDDGVATMFSSAIAPKVKRLSQNPSATLLVSNEVAESEFWVAIQGPIELDASDAFPTVHRLATRYWGEEPSAEKRQMLTYWESKADSLTTMRLHAERISSGGG